MPQYLLEPQNKKHPLARGIILGEYLRSQRFPGLVNPADEGRTIILRAEVALTQEIDRYIREELKLNIRLI